MLGEQFPHTLAAARAGADWAWSTLYRDLAPAVLGYLRARGASDAEDLTGEAFLQIVRDLPRFEGDERDFRAWVFVIAHHRLIDAGRRRARRPAEFTDELPTHAIEIDPGDPIASERVRRVIAQLAPDQRDVVLLRVLGELTVVEVAKVVGKSPGAVKALQRRGLKAMRRALAEEGVTL